MSLYSIPNPQSLRVVCYHGNHGCECCHGECHHVSWVTIDLPCVAMCFMDYSVAMEAMCPLATVYVVVCQQYSDI